MDRGNGYREAFWKIMPILSAILVGLIGTVWGLTYMELSSRINKMDEIIMCQRETVIRIESKLDLLLDKKYEMENNNE